MLRVKKQVMTDKIRGIREPAFNIPGSDIVIGRSGRVYTPTYRHKERKSYNTLNDIFAAFRQAGDILISYFGLKEVSPGEKAELKLLITKVTNLVRQLDQNPNSRERKEIESGIADLYLKLARKINKFKVKARERLGRASTVIDSRGRHNPSAQMATTSGAAFSLQQRIGQIKKIARKVKRREEIIASEIQYIRNQLAFVVGKLIELRKSKNLQAAASKILPLIIVNLSITYANPYQGPLQKINRELILITKARIPEKAETRLRKTITTLNSLLFFFDLESIK